MTKGYYKDYLKLESQFFKSKMYGCNDIIKSLQGTLLFSSTTECIEKHSTNEEKQNFLDKQEKERVLIYILIVKTVHFVELLLQKKPISVIYCRFGLRI